MPSYSFVPQTRAKRQNLPLGSTGQSGMARQRMAPLPPNDPKLFSGSAYNATTGLNSVVPRGLPPHDPRMVLGGRPGGMPPQAGLPQTIRTNQGPVSTFLPPGNLPNEPDPFAVTAPAGLPMGMAGSLPPDDPVAANSGVSGNYVPTAGMPFRRPGSGGLISNTGPLATQSRTKVVPGQFGGARLVGSQHEGDGEYDASARAAHREASLEEMRGRLTPYTNRSRGLTTSGDQVPSGREAARQQRMAQRFEQLTPARKDFLQREYGRSFVPKRGGESRSNQTAGDSRDQLRDSALNSEINSAVQSAIEKPEPVSLEDYHTSAQVTAQTIFDQVQRGDVTPDEAMARISEAGKNFPSGVDLVAIFQQMMSDEQSRIAEKERRSANMEEMNRNRPAPTIFTSPYGAF